METGQLRDRARQHLVQHFTRKDAVDGNFPIFVRGDGCYLFDSDGNRYLDGLAGLFCVNMGHGRRDIAQAAADQYEQLAYASNWGMAHPAAIDAATLISEVTPSGLDTVFFVNSGSEAVESAIKFARQYHVANGEAQRTKILSRNLAYHGTTIGALSVTQLPNIKKQFGPLMPGTCVVPNTLGYTEDCGPAEDLPCTEGIEAVIEREGADTIAALFAEPVQNSGGALVPPDGYWQALRELCDRHGILLVSDEVICSFGRLGHWFGADYTGVTPDVITFAKGSTSGYAPLGGTIIRTSLLESLYDSPEGGAFTHGSTWGGHPISTAVAAANIRAMRDEGVLPNVLAGGPRIRQALDGLMGAHRCVKEVRGTGYFYCVELMADRDAGRELTPEESVTVLRKVLPEAFASTGVLLRGDDRGATNLMISPPLVAGDHDLDALLKGVDQILGSVEKSLS